VAWKTLVWFGGLVRYHFVVSGMGWVEHGNVVSGLFAHLGFYASPVMTVCCIVGDVCGRSVLSDTIGVKLLATHMRGVCFSMLAWRLICFW